MTIWSITATFILLRILSKLISPILPLDGATVDIEKQEIDLSHTLAFGKESLSFEADLKEKRWVRIEAWDIATNGAYTQPVWLTER